MRNKLDKYKPHPFDDVTNMKKKLSHHPFNPRIGQT